ncbi:DNA-binding NarL/FixJ family response regulator/DNA-binding SARP family transcriptional activator [Nonomuraea thailandensis]|uniref:DNA-binding NarL/FixJ family response regulator/DNA-binding SARP family transcriptional activator n=1 Tax=Nonomuraea thailandensis TaxID=1188745 RepID=A0A9X2GLF5_9ACTN|nr:BTAD domain-containing putative transcriptional regulator [Nonomuraea thailandensis]MCP2359847.1 DNA-binding NarL/FixJ family response regulator/DNA-binding SARP family transcriptional activator [Nonomuraea thailandensis]
MLTFTALGPFQAWADGAPLDLGGQRQRAVLARLLVAGGRAVPVHTLIDELWPGDPPAQALSTIQGYVSRLRRALEPGRAPREEAGVLVSAPPGYALRARTDQVDAWHFESLVKSDGSPAQVWAAMDTALELWRGPALAEFAELSWAATEAGRLEELRLIAVERRADAGLALGRATSLVADLEAHASAYPLREEAWRLLAVALYRMGRQGDALAALRRARAVWRDELGLDLSAGLKRLEADMLAQRLEEPPADPVPEPGADGGVLRVLVADDQALVRTGLRAMLDSEPGFAPAGEAANGEEAIAAVRETRPDVVLLDIQMPRLDGLAAARRILAGERPPKVVMMTTFGSDENLYAALRAGVSGFLLKTSPPEQILAAIRAAAAGDALIDPAVTTRLISAFTGRTDPASPPALAGLPDDRLDVLKLVARGLTNRQIGQTLALPEEEVGLVVKSLLEHLGLFDRAQLVMAAYESGLVTPGAK